MKRGKPLKRTPMRAKPRRGGAMPAAVYEAVMRRSGYRCEAAIAGVCTGAAAEWHHRQPRDRYNDVPSNGVAICSACHRHITDVSPAVGFERGLRVSRHATRPAREFPMLLAGRRWVLLDDAGGHTPAS